jgi:transposase
MMPIPVKNSLQQTIQQLHRLRDQWKSNRNQRINLLRAILREHGFDNAARTDDFLRQATEVADDNQVLAPLAPLMRILLAEIHHMGEWMTLCEKQLKQLVASDDIIHRLDEISGLGVLTASAFVVAVGTPERFKNGRMVSGWLGITPSESASAERRRLGRISLVGNTYVRTLLIHGARSALSAAKRRAAKAPEKLTRLQQWAVQVCDRVGYNKATVALANKLVRICWAVWKHARRFDGNFVPTAQTAMAAVM